MYSNVQEKFQKSFGVVKVTSPSEYRQTDSIKCGKLVVVPGIDGKEGVSQPYPNLVGI